MSYGLIGIYALYFIFVGSNKNASKMIQSIEQDAKGFAAWLLAILVLKALSSNDTLAPMVKPFIGLALLTFVLKNYGVIVQQIDEVTGLNLPAPVNSQQYNNASPNVQIQNDAINAKK